MTCHEMLQNAMKCLLANKLEKEIGGRGEACKILSKVYRFHNPVRVPGTVQGPRSGWAQKGINMKIFNYFD